MTQCKNNSTRTRRAGFVLIEALIALLLISVGLLAVSRLQVLSISGAGEAKQYSSAMAISQRKLEDLRNILLRSQFAIANGFENVTGVAGDNATYRLDWTIAPNPVLATTEQIVLRLTTSWTDRNGVAKTIDLNSVIAWDDPGARVASANSGTLPQLVSPTGDAVRGIGQYTPIPPGAGTNPDGTREYLRGDGHKELINGTTGQILLVLPPKSDGSENFFATISGKVYFDQNAPNNSIPNSANVKLRLSSEGECIFDNATLSSTVTAGSNSYRYFVYTCYVGAGWYGNVGVVVDGSVNGQAGDPTICVGDPQFNGGITDNTLISPHPDVSATRSYRGFKGTAGAYLSTGMAAGSFYGTRLPTVAQATARSKGAPVPSTYTSSYSSVSAGATNDFFDQNFLVTNISGQQTCGAKMTGGAFLQNAGKYVCIAPDKDTGAADVCPAIWPNFENQVGNGNGIVLTVIPAGAGTGLVTSNPAGISCGATCLASFSAGSTITLSAAPVGASTFQGWSGAGCSGTGTCTVTLSAAASVTATFNTTATYALSVAISGGSGTVTSSPAGISCSSTCFASYPAATAVTLSAAAAAGSTFVGWSGATCSGTGNCVVTMSSAQSVTALFGPASTYSLTVGKSGTGTGTVTSSPAGIDCGATCTYTFPAAQIVTLMPVASGGSTFAIWGGDCSGSGPCSVAMSAVHNVTATFNAAAVTYAVTVNKSGTGTGTVTSSPSGINCGTTCTASFAAGSSMTLTAVATSGGFTGWSGAGCSGTGTCTLSSLSAAAAVTASFGTCNTPISGSAFDSNGTVVVTTPSSAGTCSMQGGNSVGYNCTLTAAAGTTVTLTNSRTNGNGPQNYSYVRTLVTNCSLQTPINFGP